MRFPFIDLQAQRQTIACEIDAAVKKVIEYGAYILGPEVGQFETALAAFEDVPTALGCANGTDALILPMMAWGIGAGDAVFCPSFTYTATAEAVALLGATPVFVDVKPDTYTICPDALAASIEVVRQAGGLTPKAVIAVDLFGQCADYPALRPVVDTHGLKLISDNAQALGGRLDGHSPAHWADVATTSFFPAKPLGCYGDGGAILSRDEALIDHLRDLAFHGRSKTPYDHDAIGLNSRLDTLQAAILLEKLKIFPREIEARGCIADQYAKLLAQLGVKTPKVIDGGVSTWAQYVIEVENRDTFLDKMRAQGIPVASYYPRPVHLQTAYKAFPHGYGLPTTEDIMTRVAALPMHAYLNAEQQDMVVAAVSKSL